MDEGGETEAWGGVGRSGGIGWRFRSERSQRKWLLGGNKKKSPEITARVVGHWELVAGRDQGRGGRHLGAKFKETPTVRLL